MIAMSSDSPISLHSTPTRTSFADCPYELPTPSSSSSSSDGTDLTFSTPPSSLSLSSRSVQKDLSLCLRCFDISDSDESVCCVDKVATDRKRQVSSWLTDVTSQDENLRLCLMTPGVLSLIYLCA